MYSLFVFFFKQKAAYEMRISDWSSDVCSSDLGGPTHPERDRAGDPQSLLLARRPRRGADRRRQRHAGDAGRPLRRLWPVRAKRRSEEHTSELQSLMRISYAVFCLQKNTDTACMHESTQKTQNQSTKQTQSK